MANDDDWAVPDSLPEHSPARLFALGDLLDAAKRRNDVALSQVSSLLDRLSADIDVAVHQLLAADEIAYRTFERSGIDESAADELTETLGMASSMSQFAARLLDPGAAATPPPYDLHQVFAVRVVADKIATQVQRRCAAIPAPVCALGHHAEGPDRLVALNLAACGTADLHTLAARWEHSARCWRTRIAVFAAPPALAEHLDVCRAGTVLGDAIDVRFDMVPLAERVADRLGCGVPLVEAYDAAFLAGSTCEVVRVAAAEHYSRTGGMD